MQQHTPQSWCPRAILRAAAVAAISAGAALASVSAFGQAVPLTITKAFGAASIPVNGTTTLTFNLANTSGSVTLNNVSFTDSLPAGLVVSTPNGLTGTCGDGVATAVAGSGTVALTGTTAPPGASCSFAVNVTGTTAGVKNNTVTVTATQGTGSTGTASVTVAGATAAPTVTKAFGAASVALNDVTTLTFTIQNPNATDPLTGVGITDTLPAGMTVATPNGLTGSCGGGTITATAGGGSVTLTGATLAGAGSCSFTVNVVAGATGTLNNSVSVTSTEGGAGVAGTATLQVAAVAVNPPTITKSFGAPTIAPNGSASLTFTIQNPNAGTALTGVAFTDPLPSGLTVATPNNLNGTCGGGTIDALAGGSSVALSGATIAGGGSCSFTVSVTAVGSGLQVNTTGAVSSTNGGTGGTASATILISDATTTGPNLIPTLGGWVLVALSALLAGGTLVYLRRRER